MKVAYLLGSLNRGGTETLLLDSFRKESIASFDMVAIYRKEGVLSSQFKNTSVKIVRIAPRGFWDLMYILRLRRYLKLEGVDIVHAQQAIDAIYAKLALLGTTIRVIQTFHGYDFGLNKLNKLLYAISIRVCKMNVFVSEAQRNYYLDRYCIRNCKQLVISNGINFSKFDLFKGTNIRNELKIENSVPLLGMVGSFVPVRDHITICRFLDLLNKKDINFHFVFIGKECIAYPELYVECFRFCEEKGLLEKVHFLGLRDDVPEVLSQLDAFVYASNHDTFGIAVIEALAAGIPVFVNDWEVMREVSSNGDLANLYKTKDIEDLFILFEQFLLNPTEFKQKSKFASDVVRLKYSIEAYLTQLALVYKSLLN